MLNYLRVAAVAIPVALLPAQAHANPMVAVGWLWAAGAGGVVLGILGTLAYQQNRVAVVTPAYAEPAPVVYAQPGGCRNVRITIDGRSRRAQICD